MKNQQTIQNLLLKFLSGLIIGIIVTSGYFTQCTGPVITSDGIHLDRIVITRDTIRVPQVVTHTNIIKVKDPVIVDTLVDTIRVNKLVKQGMRNTYVFRTYVDSVIATKGVTLGYRAKVLGFLDSMTLTFRDTRPKEYIRIDSTIIKFVPYPIPRDKLNFSAGGFADSRSFGPSLELRMPRTTIGADYSILHTPSATFSQTPINSFRVRLLYNFGRN